MSIRFAGVGSGSRALTCGVRDTQVKVVAYVIECESSTTMRKYHIEDSTGRIHARMMNAQQGAQLLTDEENP